MKLVKVTAWQILTLTPEVELIENLVSDGEELGPHLKIGDQFYSPMIRWVVFVPAHMNSPAEQKLGLGHGYAECEECPDFELFTNEPPVGDHSMEVLEE